MAEENVAELSDSELESSTNDEAAETEQTSVHSASNSGKLEDLEEEGELAADYLEELLDITDLDGDIDIDVHNGRAYISILSDSSESSELEVLVGENGQTLEALQELTRLSILAKVGGHSRLLLDVNGYRDRRKKELVTKTLQHIEQVKESGQKVALTPMSSFERKIVHDEVAEHGLASESFGQGAERHIVISPAE